jgi:hypothetical protein
MKKLTSFGIGMGIVLACTVVSVSADDRYNNNYRNFSIIGAFGLADNALARVTTLPGYTPRPVPRPPKVPSVLDIHSGSLYPVRVGGPDAKPPINHHLDEPSG